MKTKIEFFCALSNEDELISAIVDHVAGPEVGLLASYAYFKNVNVDAYCRSRLKVFADCGAFSLGSQPRMYWNHGIEHLADFLKSADFQYITELDLRVSDRKARMRFAARLNLQLHQFFGDTLNLDRLMRPIHGGYCNERIEYFDYLKLKTGISPMNVALGGLDMDSMEADIIETAKVLAGRGVRNLHIFGTSSNKTFALLQRLAALGLFAVVSADSSTYAQSVINNGICWLYNSDKNDFDEVWFSRKAAAPPSPVEIEALGSCECPACTGPLFAEEKQRLHRTVDLGLSQIRGNDGSKPLFDKKAQIHNCFHICKRVIFMNESSI